MSSVIISGDTSGAITLAAPAVSGTNTATFPAATGTVQVSGNMPAFSAYAASNQTLTSSVTTKVVYGTEEFDTNNNFASSTFTPTVAGYYQINTGMQVGYTTLVRFNIQLWKNGALYKRLVDFNSYTGNSVCGSSIVYLNGSTDYIEIYSNMNGTGTLTVNGGSVDLSWFNAALIRVA